MNPSTPPGRTQKSKCLDDMPLCPLHLLLQLPLAKSNSIQMARKQLMPSVEAESIGRGEG
jgi:hypothetical protein